MSTSPSMRRWLINIVLVAGLAVMVYAIWEGTRWQRFLTRPLITGDQAAEIIIQPGTPLIKLAWDLKRQGFITEPQRFVLLARLYGATQKIQAGEYRITPGMTPRHLLRHIIAGKVILRSITLVEGWTFQQALAAINNNPYLTHTLNNLDNATIMAKLGYLGINPEGQFYPDTYLFNRGMPDVQILRQAYRAMQIVLNRAWQQRTPGLWYQNPYQVLIAASLIEKETALPQERPLIAGVIIRRLQRNMPLQIDAAVIYGLGASYTGTLTRSALTIPTPYNTYLYRGLPPTPIALPSAASIQAALQPAAGDALYYVAKGDGSHVFSATFTAHQQAVQQYLLLKARVAKPASWALFHRCVAFCGAHPASSAGPVCYLSRSSKATRLELKPNTGFCKQSNEAAFPFCCWPEVQCWPAGSLLTSTTASY